MDLGILITACAGVLTSFMASFATWFFSRKKYNAEVDNTTIENLSKSVEVYKTIVKDLETKIDSYIGVSEENRLEVIRLKGIVFRIINKVCVDGSCINRQPYSAKEVEEIMGIISEGHDINIKKRN